MIETLIWSGFFLLIVLFVALDLGVFHRHPHAIRIREAIGWSVVWIVAALLFNIAVYFIYEHHWMVWGASPREDAGMEAAVQFFTGYIVEKSLSLDNIFVIAMIFTFFRVPASLQHRVLFWGILGAVVMRGLMIAAGTALIHYLDWVTYVFGALLLYSAYRMAFLVEADVDPAKNRLVRLTRRFFPVVAEFEGQRFFVKRDGRWAMTPLFLALLVVESSDVMFAVDSIPAVLAITRDPFIVFTSNVFAMLGLRALYFAVAGLMELFEHLRTSLVVLLAYMGVKMLVSHHFPIPNRVSLVIIASILAVGIVASLVSSGRSKTKSPVPAELDSLPKGLHEASVQQTAEHVGSGDGATRNRAGHPVEKP